MNKYYIDEEAYAYLNEWATQNRTAVVWSPYYFKNVEIVFKGSEFKFYVEAKTDYFKFNLKNHSGLIYSGKILHDTTGANDFLIEYNIKAGLVSHDEYSEILSSYCNAFFNANCYMWIGNLVDNKEYSAAGKNDGKDKIITFRKYKDTVYAVSVGSHRSPDGVFSVRGHLRKYKSGKVIWIDEYFKGIGNKG